MLETERPQYDDRLAQCHIAQRAGCRNCASKKQKVLYNLYRNVIGENICLRLDLKISKYG